MKWYNTVKLADLEQPLVTQESELMEKSTKPEKLPQETQPEQTENTEDEEIPSEVKDELFARGLDPKTFHQHAVAMMSSLDTKHASDPHWNEYIAAVRTAMQKYPMIHATQWQNIARIAKIGIVPAHSTGRGFEFDKQTGLDKVVYMRQGQAGGGGNGTVGVMIDPKRLDTRRFLVTKLGLMGLKAEEESMLHTPGDHSALLDKQLQPFRESTIDFQSLPDVQARLLVDGFLKDHPDGMFDPTKVVENDKGVMEVKYVGSIPTNAIIAYFAGNKPLEDGKTATQHLQGVVPPELIITYNGESLIELSKAYRAHYAYKQAMNWYKLLRLSQFVK